jgi:hypothetical protein
VKTKCKECGKRYSGLHPQAACQLWAATRVGNKYNAVRTERDGRSFSSGLEGDTYDILNLRLKGGEFDAIACQVHVHMRIPGTNYRVIYIADFRCDQGGMPLLFVEAKGKEFPKWKMIKEMWPVHGPGVPLEIWKSGRRGPMLVETIQPKQGLA